MTNPSSVKRLKLQMNSSVGWLSCATQTSSSGGIVAIGEVSFQSYDGLFMECTPSITWMLTKQIGCRASARFRNGFVKLKTENHGWAGLIDEEGNAFSETIQKQENRFTTSYIPLELSVSWSF